MHHAVICGGSIPHAESGVVLDADADERGAGTLGRGHPLAGVQLGGIEDGGVQIRVGPIGLLEGGKPEMHEHVEAKVYELLLELMEALVLGRCFVTKTY